MHLPIGTHTRRSPQAPEWVLNSVLSQVGFSLWRTFQELPWHVVPFLFGMFILVEALALGGWVDYFARVTSTPPPLVGVSLLLSLTPIPVLG